MSVLFVACKGLKKLEGVSAQDVSELERFDVIGIDGEPGCTRLVEGLEIGAAYEFLEDHWFTFGRRHEFYENLSSLASFAGFGKRKPDENESSPFCELFLNLETDMFGPVVSAKLAADFATWDPLAQARGWLDESFYDSYKHWWNMFVFAGKEGLVRLQCM
jgi:hypothetical protein